MQHMGARKRVFGSLSEDSEVEMSFSMADVGSKLLFKFDPCKTLQGITKIEAD